MNIKYLSVSFVVVLTIIVSVFSFKHKKEKLSPHLANDSTLTAQNIYTNHYSQYSEPFFKAKNITNAISPLLQDINDDKVLSLLSILTNARPGTILSHNNDGVKLYLLLHQIGNIAASNDLAFSFLKKSINPEFWKAHRAWKWETGDENSNDEMAGISIGCLGVSCRPEVPDIFERLIANASLKFIASQSGAFVDAHYFMSIIKAMGRENFNNLDGEQRMSKFVEWIKTPEGRKLSEWRQKIDLQWMEQKNSQSNLQ